MKERNYTMKKKLIIIGIASLSLLNISCFSKQDDLSKLSLEQLNQIILEQAQKNTPVSGHNRLNRLDDLGYVSDKILHNQMQSRRFIFKE